MAVAPLLCCVWQCCYGTGVESFAKLADAVYFTETATGALIIGRYVHSRLAPIAPSALALRQKADIARTGRATLTIDAASQHRSGQGGAREHTIKLFVPSWAVEPSVRVNGVDAPTPTPGSFAVLQRAWSVGDQIELTLPCVVRLSPLDDARDAYRRMYSFMYGDTLLVGLVGSADPTLLVPADLTPEDWVRTAVKRVEGHDLRFVAAGADAHTIILMPLNEVIDERYTVYFNLTVLTTAIHTHDHRLRFE